MHHVANAPFSKPADWQHALQNAVTDAAELLQLLQLPDELLAGANAAAKQFPLRVPRGFVERMRPNDPQDPLLQQVLPLGRELEVVEGFSTDPVGDALAKAETGVIHKYHGRALLISTGACAIHCRYCFRRHFPYQGELAARQQWQTTLRWLDKNPHIEEVILSGGDPLSLSDQKLAPLIEGLAARKHIHTLRIHSRQPIVLPERITAALIAQLQASQKQIVMVVHCNHANEINGAVAQALNAMRQAQFHLLNQAVLLKGINDHLPALENLSRTLFAHGVIPYYLHSLDAVQGAAHFDVPLPQATQLHQALNARLPGYLVPKLVKEIAGEANKTPIHPI